MEANPINILFVKSDSKGDRLLFRYPCNFDVDEGPTITSHRRSPYSLPVNEIDFYTTQPNSKVLKNCLTGLSDEALSTLFAVKADLVDRKFELKINDVRFVGHPTLVQAKDSIAFSNVILINIVFALHAGARPSIVKCYYDLSKRLGKVLKYEEEKTSYLSKEIIALISAHDFVSSNMEEGGKMDTAAYELIIKQSEIAQNIKKIYEELVTSGLIYIKINKSHQFSFCLPQKVHKFYCRRILIEPELIDNSMKKLKSYHGLLLLTEPNRLLDSLYADSSTPLIKVIKLYSPLKSIQTLSTDTGLGIGEISSLIGSLVYWGKASIIFPLCASNVYTIAPEASTHTNSSLVEKFLQVFPGHSLLSEISEFSLPVSLKQRISPLSYPHEQREIAQMVVWMLQHRLLIQLHTYIFYVPMGSMTDNKSRLKTIGDEYRTSHDSNVLTLSCEKDGWSKLLAAIGNDKNESELLKLESELKPLFLKLPSTVGVEDLKLFMKFYRQGYFNGSHHIEEIMYLENKTRSQIYQLIDKMRQVLVTCDIEDSYISMFYPHTHNCNSSMS